MLSAILTATVTATSHRIGLSQGTIDSVGSCAKRGWHDMRVQVHRDAELRVSEDIHDDAGGNTLSQQEGRARVSKVVHPDATNASLHDQRVQNPRKVSGLHGRTSS